MKNPSITIYSVYTDRECRQGFILDAPKGEPHGHLHANEAGNSHGAQDFSTGTLHAYQLFDWHSACISRDMHEVRSSTLTDVKKILFPVDFSERSNGAARYVEAMAGWFESEVMLLHVVDTGSHWYPEDAKPHLNRQM